MAGRSVRHASRWGAAALILTSLLCTSPLFAKTTYGLLYTAHFLPSQGLAQVSIRVDQDSSLIRKLEFAFEAERMFRFEGDGTIATAGDSLVWDIPATGGELRYAVRVDHLREDAEYDARLSHDWALLRGSDLFPPGVTTSRKDAYPETRLRLRLPPSWKALLPFPKDENGAYIIEDGGTRFDRPSGWMLLGVKLQTRSAQIGRMKVSIGGPSNHDVRVRDLIALLRWTLPTLEEIVEVLPPSLLIVTAEDPMWRGGLSGPSSIYLHAERPLIASDGTSPVLHELIHVVMRAIGGERGDWIVEGIAEYYGLELLRRSGTISPEEYDQTLARLRRKAVPMARLGSGDATAADTARGVLVMSDLDKEIRKRSDGARSLDDVLRALTQRRGALGAEQFVAVLRTAGGGDFSSLLPPIAKR